MMNRLIGSMLLLLTSTLVHTSVASSRVESMVVSVVASVVASEAVPVAADTVQVNPGARMAVVTLSVVRDDSTITGTIEIQPLDTTEFVVVANRIFFVAYRIGDFYHTGLHSQITLYDSVSQARVGGWYEPFDHHFSETESFVLCVVSSRRPLTYTFTERLPDCTFAVNSFIIEYCRIMRAFNYAVLGWIAGYPKDLFCELLPEICAEDPWTYDRAAMYRGKPDLKTAPATKHTTLTHEQFKKIVYEVQAITPLTSPLVATVTPPIHR